ncbi:MAG: hypothetical protein AAGK09_00075 [Planctomycetota bacterium]
MKRAHDQVDTAGVEDGSTRGARASGGESSGARVGGAWMFAGQVVWAASQWAVIAVVAKQTVPESVGEFVIAMGIATPTFLMLGLGLRALAAGDVAARRSMGAYAATRGLGAVLAAAITLAGGMAAVDSPSARAIVIAVVLLKLADHASDLIYGVGLATGQARAAGLSMIVRGMGGVVAAAVTILATASLAAGIAAMAGWWLAVAIAFDRRTWMAARRVWRERLAKPDAPRLAERRAAWLWPVIRPGVPLGVVAGLGALMVYVPAYYLNAIDPALTGVFGALNYGGLVLTLAGLAWGQAATPGFARLADRPGRFCWLLAEVNGGLIVLGLLGAAAALLISDPVVARVYTPEYAGHSGALAWIMIGATGYNVVTVSGYAAMTRDRVALQPVWLVIGVGVEAGLMWWWFDGLTLFGSGLAMAIGASVAAAGMTGLALWPRRGQSASTAGD